MKKTKTKKGAVVVEEHTSNTTFVAQIGSTVTASLQRAAASLIKPSGGASWSTTTTTTSSSNSTDNNEIKYHNTSTTVIIPSYPANNHVDATSRRPHHFISFCIVFVAAMFSYAAFNILLMKNRNHHYQYPTTAAARSLLLESSRSSILGSSSSSGGGIFSSMNSNHAIGHSHDPRQHYDDASSSSSSFSSIAGMFNRKENRNVENKKSQDDYFAQVRTFLNANEPRRALQELLQADAFYPDHVELKLYLGSTYTLLIEYDKAIGAYQKALDLIERDENDKDNKVYKMRALTMMGVLHRGRGRIEQAIEWLERSVAYSNSIGAQDRENRNYLAQCHFLTGNTLDGIEQLIEIIRRDLAEDDDYRLLSYALSATEEWQLLGGVLQQCLYLGYCTLSLDSVYPTDQILIEYAVALDKVGQAEAALTQLQEAARIATASAAANSDASSPSHGTAQQQAQSLQDARQRAQTYISEAAEGTKKALVWIESQKDQVALKEESARKWEAMAQIVKTSMRIGLPAWSTMFERHYNSFRWPISSVLIGLVVKEINDDKAAVAEAASVVMNDEYNSILTTATPFLLPNRILEIVSRSACHSIHVYSFSDCVLYAKVNAAKRQHALRQENKVSVQTYHDFQQATYRPLLRDTDILHLGIFSDLKYPMVNMIWSLIRNTHRKNNANTNVRITLYHPRDVTPSVLDFVVPLVSSTVECTEDGWADCVEHARRNKVQVWLETSGDAVEGIPSIMASGPAPVGISWGGTVPGSLGLPSTVQYMITDRYSVPPDSAVSAEYPEKMIYIPGSWLNVEPEAPRVGNLTIDTVRNEYNIPAEAVIYCFFGRLSKITDEVFRLWSDIVNQVPGSVLVLCNWHPSNDPIPRMRKAWKDRGLASDRLIVFPFFSFGGHLSVLSALSDGTTIALDALEYSGAMTTYNAIQAGIPVIHCSISWKITQRMAGSVLTAAGLGKDLIVPTVNKYEELAVLMGTNATAYQEVKSKTVNARPLAPLFQNRYGLSGMIAGLRMAYLLWYAGRPPQTMYADAPQEIPGERKSNNNSTTQR
jgi:predicted O-linked N-acetylglucosamine transferase (SPINDLY family)